MAKTTKGITDTDRLNYLLQFISISDVGDEDCVLGISVKQEPMETKIRFGPPWINGRMVRLVHEWNDNLRDVIDRAIIAHSFLAEEEG